MIMKLALESNFIKNIWKEIAIDKEEQKNDQRGK